MKPSNRLHILIPLVVLACLGVLLAGCSKNEETTTSPSQTTTPAAQTQTPASTAESALGTAPVLVQSSVERIVNPAVDPADVQQLVTDDNSFALDLLSHVNDTIGNLILSPYSVSEALAMAYAGARGETATQMSEALGFTLDASLLFSAFNALDESLTNQDRYVENPDSDRFQLTIANALWGQTGYSFLPDFLDLLAANFGAGIETVNFREAPENARQAINDWADAKTEGKVVDLVGPGMITESTRLVLTNAVYFSAAWKYPFEESATVTGTFTAMDGVQTDVAMMNQTTHLNYSQVGDFQAVELPYENSSMSMVIFLPNANAAESALDEMAIEEYTNLLDAMSSQAVALQLPRFSFDAPTSLVDALARMGMSLPFRGGEADFSGMDGTQELFIGDVIHNAFISVDEKGTEAAAATAILMVGTAAPGEQPLPIPFVVDHPFLFVIRDAETGTILFIGEVADSTGMTREATF